MAKHPGGRPPKYSSDFCSELIQHMAQGRSFESFAAAIYHQHGVSVCIETLYRWARDHEEFSQAKKEGHALAYDFWEELGNTAVNSPSSQFNSTVWIFNMKNRFQWADKVEAKVIGDPEKPIKHEVTVDVATATMEQLMDIVRGS